jgi:hypothetical protein
MRSQRGRRDDDASWRWGFTYVYGREPAKAELATYKHQRPLEIWRSFNPVWLSPEAIAALAAADAATAPQVESAPPESASALADKVTAEENLAPHDAAETPHVQIRKPSVVRKNGQQKKHTPRSAAARSPKVQQARALLHDQLANGPRPVALPNFQARAARCYRCARRAHPAGAVVAAGVKFGSR